MDNVLYLASTAVTKIEHRADSTTLHLRRPNITLSVATDSIGDVDAVLHQLRLKHHNRYQISGRFLQERSRELRNRRWGEMLKRAEVVDHRQPAEPPKRKGRPRKVKDA